MQYELMLNMGKRKEDIIYKAITIIWQYRSKNPDKAVEMKMKRKGEIKEFSQEKDGKRSRHRFSILILAKSH